MKAAPECEQFADDLADAGGDFLQLAEALHARGASGDCWFGVLGYLVLQLADIVAGRNKPIKLTSGEMKVAVRAYTNISRTFSIIQKVKRDLVLEKDWPTLLVFGELMRAVWHQIPGEETVRNNLPGMLDPNHPIWRKKGANR